MQEFAVRKYRIANKARPHARGRGIHILKNSTRVEGPPTRARTRDTYIEKLNSSAGTAHTCEGWGNVSFSDGIGRDSRTFKTSAYMVICVEDSTGRNYSRTLA